MNVSTVLAGCLVLVLCAVNTQACPDNLVLVIDCLDKNNAAQWTTVKNYVKYIIQHLPGDANVSHVPMALAVADGREDGSNLVIPLGSSYDTNKVAMMGFVNDIKMNRRDNIKLLESMRVFDHNVVIPIERGDKVNAVVIIRDSSVPDGITNDDAVHGRITANMVGHPMNIYIIRINDAIEQANMDALVNWGKDHSHLVNDYPKNKYTDLTHIDAFDFVNATLACDPPFGSAEDAQEAVPTGITLPTHTPTVSSAQSLTKTSSRVVGLWMCVLAVTTAALSTF